MYPVSPLYKEKIQENSRTFDVRIEIEHSAGVLSLTDKDIVNNTLIYSESTQGSEEFTIGGTVASDLTIEILNRPEYEGIKFMGATVKPSIGLLISSVDDNTYFMQASQPISTIDEDLYEYVPLGRFNIDDDNIQRNTIKLKAMDNMINFDLPYSLSKLSYPATLYQIYVNACNVADVNVGTPTFPNMNYVVQSRPEDDLTLRDMIGYVAELSGTFAKCNRNGALELRWYKPSGVTIGPTNRFNFIPRDDLVQIKGIMATVGDTTYLAGADDYAIDLSDNPLLQGGYETVLPNIFNNVKNTVFTPYDSSWQGNPALQAGDMINQIDRDGKMYSTLITNSTYKFRGSCTLSAKGLPEIAKGYKGSTNKKIANIIRKVEKEVGDRLTTIEQAQLNATEMLANMLGGHIIQDNENGILYIADNKDVNLAVRVWKYGINGFGYSETGVNGPYTTAITADGSIVAMLVAANIITANMVQTGILQSEDGSVAIDLTNNSFNFKNQLKWDGVRDKLILGPKTELTWASITSKPDIEGIVNEAVGGIEIGGRNLILNSKGFKTTDGYLLATYNMSEDWELDTEYTITIKCTVNSGQQFGIWLNGDQTNGTMFTPDSSDITKHTFRTPSHIINNVPKLMAIYNYPSSHATSSYIEWVKLERGNQATDWTPAPEDVEQLIPTDGHITTITKNNVTTEFINAMEIIAKYVSASAVINIGDKTSGNYIEISPDNPIKVWRNNKLVSSLGYSEIGGGNLTIYDRYGAKAFWAECLEDGDFQLFFNDDTAMIPDPNHPGFYLPNPNRRKAIIEAGAVVFKNHPYVVAMEPYGKIATIGDIKSLEYEINQLKSSLSNKADVNHSHTAYASSTHTHTGYASSYHSHSIGYGGDPSHSHSMY